MSKNIQARITQEIVVPDGVEITAAPDGDFPCVKIGDQYYQPGIYWMKYVPHGDMEAGIPSAHWDGDLTTEDEITEVPASVHTEITELPDEA